MALQRTTITVELDVLHRAETTCGDVTSDLQKILDAALSRGLLQEQPPYRHVTGGTWWTHRATITTTAAGTLEAGL
jgi:hypothetical protein